MGPSINKKVHQNKLLDQANCYRRIFGNTKLQKWDRQLQSYSHCTRSN